MLDLRQTPIYAKYMEAIGWKVDTSQGFYAYIKKFPILGNFIKVQRPEHLNYPAIERLRKKYRPFQIVIEPISTVHCSLITEHGFHQSKTYFVPSKTIQIDLTKTENLLLKEMHYKTRYNIKKVQSAKFKVQSTKNVEEFADFWQKCALKQRGMFLSNKKEIIEIYKAFTENTYILNIYNSIDLAASVLMICTKDVAYYMYAASTDKGKKFFAPTLAAWEAIKLAKKLKKKVFDFEGIYDERFPIKSWQGFTRFKKSFGGKVVEYPGCYTKYYIPFL